MPSILNRILHPQIPDALLIFNASSGNPTESEAQLQQINRTLGELNVTYQLVQLDPKTRIHHVAARAARRGVPFIIACGGDNTIDLVARGIAGTRSTLVVVPTGTRNNIARSLNLPTDLAEAVRLISSGRRTSIDVGRARVAGGETFFLELFTIGLSAAMFPALDDAQKGNLARIGDVLGTFITNPPAKFRLNLERGQQKIDVQALTLLVLNLPYLGANFQIASSVDYQDGLLDVFLFSDLGKLDLLTYALQVARGFTDDPRVRHVRVQQLTVETDPPLPIMLDGNVLKQNALRRRKITLRAGPHYLNVMVPANEKLE